jgi:membrane protein
MRRRILNIYSYFIKIGESIVEKAKKITFPGFDKVPLHDVAVFFIRSMVNGSITTRASSIAFNMFLALFPAIIFFFTLIPYIPVNNFQNELLDLFKEIFPTNVYNSLIDTLTDIVTIKRGGLLSVGFIAALYFSTNGISALMGAFNATYLTFETRSFIAQKLISVFLVIIITLLITVAIILLIFSQFAINYLIMAGILKLNITYYLVKSGNWIIIIALFFFAISFLYYLAPAKKTKWKFISAGSSLATLLTIVTSIGFSYYVNNFGSYNKLYGTIGTLIALLLWMYFNALILLIGFELNTSISNAQLKGDVKYIIKNKQNGKN